MIEDDRRPPPLPLYWLFALVVIALALGGYAGFVVYARSGLSAGAGGALLALAAAAGTASFFSPCSFGLLVTLLARETGAASQPADARTTGRALMFATGLAVGAVTFLLLLGVGIAAGGDALFRHVTFTSTTGRIIRSTVGVALVTLGLAQLNAFRLPGLDTMANAATNLQRAQAKLRRRRPLLGFALFGFGYLLAGFG